MQALGGRIAIPLSGVRSRVEELSNDLALRIEAANPGLRVRGQAHALGAPIVFSARLDADGIRVEGDARTVTIRLSDVELSTDENAPGPLAEAIRDGMIDTENPATLIGNMMPLPDAIVLAEGQEVIVDLLKLPAIERDQRLRNALAAVTSYLCVTEIEAKDDSIVLELGLLPGGAKEAALSTARAALTPVVHYLWPEGRP
jgi:hypothetical protein